MFTLTFGIVGFFLFVAYEFHTVTKKFSTFKPFFFIGISLIILSSCIAAYITVEQLGFKLINFLIFGFLGLVFLLLLVYSLFFAVPFSKTYVDTKNHKAPVCTTGMYALCRHPGVIWFAGFYLFFWLSFGGTILLWQFIIYSTLNLLYIILQDKWSFIKCFDGYDTYKKNTPFLIPNIKSIIRCFKTFNTQRGNISNEI